MIPRQALERGRPLVKICGLTRPEDVLLAAELGAWAVGFVFAPSPRRLTPAVARTLVATVKAGGGAAPPLAIGVFGDASAGEIAAAVEEADLDGVQLHGLHGPGGAAVTAALAGRERGLLVVQAIPVPAEVAAEDAKSLIAVLRESIARAREQAELVLLDTAARGRFGGSGVGFAWSLAREAADGEPLLVAGGIDPGNLQGALEGSGAWGVDVSSGVEASPGVKDPLLLRRLFAAAGATGGSKT